MRLHKLSFSALGPFPKKVELDFDALSTEGLFLIEGPTGSGKSILIDAIVFALYGQVAGGSESSKTRLRSNYAKENQKTEVILVFSIGQTYYRLRRTPSYYRLSRKSVVHPTVLLERISGPDLEGRGEALADKQKDVSLELDRIFGLKVEHFLQTAVLPQGRFQEFLVAKDRDRYEVLSSLFDSEIYKRMETLSKEKLNDLQANQLSYRDQVLEFLRGLSITCSDQIESICQLNSMHLWLADGDNDQYKQWGIDLEEIVLQAQNWDVAQAALVLPRLNQIVKEQLAVLSTAKEITEGLKIEADRAQKDLQTALQAQDDFKQAQLALEQLETLNKLRDHMESQSKLAKKAQAAQSLTGILKTAQQRQDQLCELARSLGERAQEIVNTPGRRGFFTASQLKDLTKFYALPTDKFTKREGQYIKQCQEDLALLLESTQLWSKKVSDWIQTEKLLQTNLEQRSQWLEELEEATSAKRETETCLSKTLRDRCSWEESLNLAKEAAKSAQYLEDQLKTQRKNLDLIEKSIETQELFENLKDRLDDQLRELDCFSQKVFEKKRAWLSGLAADFARDLEPGLPCMVCGCVKHPNPATASGQSIDRETVESLEAQEQELRQIVETTRSKLANCQGTLSTLFIQAGLEENTNLQDLREQLLQIREIVQDSDLQLAELNEQAAHETELLELLTNSAETITQAKKDIAVQETIITQRSEQLQQIDQKIEKDTSFLGHQMSSVPNTEEAYEPGCLQPLQELVEQLVKTLQDTVQLLASYQPVWIGSSDAWKALDRAVASSGFHSVSQAMDIVLDADQIDEIQATVKQWKEKKTKLEGLLETQKMVQALNSQPPEVEPLELKATELFDKLQDSNRLVGILQSNTQRVQSCMENLTDVIILWDKDVEEIRQWEEISHLLCGNGIEKIRLSSYFLARRLSTIVSVANEAIDNISDGFYRLERVDNEQGTQSREYRGLGLSIYDERNGVPRPPASLSGGEKFYVALALALALATVVQEERGGVRIETMFVDEGFGSLSSDYLEQVLELLHQVSSQGKTIGVISHVPQLKQSINNQIQVRRNTSDPSNLGGSTVFINLIEQ